MKRRNDALRAHPGAGRNDMIHLHHFITRMRGLSNEHFRRYWRETHGPIAKRLPGLKGYVQSHRIPFSANNSSWDGEAEVWLDGLDALQALLKSPEYVEEQKDEPKFIDMARADMMIARDHVIIEGPRTAVKGVWRLRRKPGMTLADFRRYWIEIHGVVASKIPGVRRYVQSHLIDEAYSYAEPRWDGVAQLWWDSAAAFAAALQSPEWEDDVLDGAEFVDPNPPSMFFLAEEYQVIRPA